MRYSIPECNIESLEKKLTRIKNKCAKYGCEFKYERVGEHFEDRTFYEYDYDAVDAFGTPASRKWTETVKFIDVDVEGVASVNGWEFAASLEYTTAGNIIKGVEGIEIPERYYSCAPWCEHCKTARDRKYSYVVYHRDSGEFKQVGKSCLNDFTGGLSAVSVANFESFFKECEEASEFRGLGGWAIHYFDVKEFMETVAGTIRVYGYAKNDGYNLSTVDRAEEIYRKSHGMRISQSAEGRIRDAEGRGFDVKNGVELAKDVREWILNSDRKDNYFHNLKVACGLDYCDGRTLGLLASAFPTYNRELEWEAEKKAREAREKEAAAKSSWMGKIGDKVSFVIADYYVISSWETQWGTTTVFRFTDEGGREATWKTSNWFTADEVIGGTIKGTIKELKEYRGIKQTELTRCKIEKVERPAKSWVDTVSPALDMLYA